ncbi:MAG TPA: hypothetical protein DEA91_02940 [Paenibacillus sp.]|nr:hypothetical protein [Paenibacillus sp.]
MKKLVVLIICFLIALLFYLFGNSDSRSSSNQQEISLIEAIKKGGEFAQNWNPKARNPLRVRSAQLARRRRIVFNWCVPLLLMKSRVNDAKGRVELDTFILRTASVFYAAEAGKNRNKNKRS